MVMVKVMFMVKPEVKFMVKVRSFDGYGHHDFDGHSVVIFLVIVIVKTTNQKLDS